MPTVTLNVPVGWEEYVKKIRSGSPLVEPLPKFSSHHIATRIAEDAKWCMVVNPTYSIPHVRFHTNEELRSQFGAFLEEYSALRGLCYLFVWEYHKNEVVHYHGLIFKKKDHNPKVGKWENVKKAIQNHFSIKTSMKRHYGRVHYESMGSPWVSYVTKDNFGKTHTTSFESIWKYMTDPAKDTTLPPYEMRLITNLK